MLRNSNLSDLAILRHSWFSHFALFIECKFHAEIFRRVEMKTNK